MEGLRMEEMNTYVILDEWNNDIDESDGRIIGHPQGIIGHPQGIIGHPQEHIYLVDIQTQAIEQIVQPISSVPQPVEETIVHTELSSTSRSKPVLGTPNHTKPNNQVFNRPPENQEDKALKSCDYCDFQHKNLANLKKHMKFKHTGKKIQCDECDYKAGQNYDLKRHKEAKHSSEVFPCDQCSYIANQSAALATHIRVKHTNQNFDCAECNFSTSYSSALHRHIQTHRIELHCSSCDYVTTRKDNLKAHFENKHNNVRFECNECVFSGSSQSSLRNHQDAVHKGVRYKCDLCKFESARRQNLQCHRRAKHFPGQKQGTPGKKLSAYLLFYKDQNKVVERNQPWLTKMERRHLLKQKWEQLDKEEKTKYQRLASGKSNQPGQSTESPAEPRLEPDSTHGLTGWLPASMNKQVSVEQFQSSSDKPISIVLHKPVEVANEINQHPMKVVDTVGHQTLEVARQPLEVAHQPHQPLHGDKSNLETVLASSDETPTYNAEETPTYNTEETPTYNTEETPTYNTEEATFIYMDDNGDYINVITETTSEETEFISLPHQPLDKNSIKSLSLRSPPLQPDSKSTAGDAKSIRLFPCDQCSYTAKHAHHLKSHKRSKHDPEWIFCEHCQYKAKRHDLLKRHIQSAHEKIRYNCDYCDHLTPDLTSLKKHMQSMHLGKLFPCSFCEQLFKHKSTRLRHIKSEHKQQNISCDSAEKLETHSPVVKDITKLVNTPDTTITIQPGRVIRSSKSSKAFKRLRSFKNALGMSGEKGPKRPPTKYLLFCQDERPKIMAANPSRSIIEIGGELGRRWRALDPSSAKQYEDRYAESMVLYKEQLAAMQPAPQPDAVKPPVSPFFIFLSGERQKVRDLTPNISITDEVARVAERWSKLPRKEKDYFSAEYKAAYRRYKIDKSNLERRMNGMEELDPLVVQQVLQQEMYIGQNKWEKEESSLRLEVNKFDSSLTDARRIIGVTKL